MKRYLFILIIILLSGCGPTLEQKLAKIDDIEKEIYSPSTTLNLTDEDYYELRKEVEEKEADLILKKRYGLYVKLMSSFLDPETSLEMKNKIIMFFQFLNIKSLFL